MSSAPETRHSLLLQLGQHSEDAWEEFLFVYEGAIRRYCLSLGLQDADARDATQEVLAAVHGKLPTWNADPNAGRFRAWLFRVARNVAVDTIAARTRGVLGTASEVERMMPTRMEHETALDLEYRRTLYEWAADQVRSEVLEKTWQAFQLTAVRGRTAEAAATELGISIGSVYTAKCRVVARLRERIARFDASDGVAHGPEERQPERPNR